MSEKKARLVAVIILASVLLICADIVARWPSALPWVLGVFAFPGACKFARVVYKWLMLPDKPNEAEEPEERHA